MKSLPPSDNNPEVIIPDEVIPPRTTGRLSSESSLNQRVPKTIFQQLLDDIEQDENGQLKVKIKARIQDSIVLEIEK